MARTASGSEHIEPCLFGSSDFSGGRPMRHEVEATAMEVDGDFEMIAISEAAGALLNRGNL